MWGLKMVSRVEVVILAVQRAPRGRGTEAKVDANGC
jgi:hypothetical protein